MNQQDFQSSEIHLLTFVDVIKGLSSPTLHSQYFDEYLKLSKYVDSVRIISSNVSNVPELPKNVEIITPKISKIPKIRGITKMLNYLISSIKLRKKINLLYVRTVSPPEIFTSWIMSSFFNIPLILLIGGTCVYEPITFKNRIFHWILARTINSSEKIILYSDRMIPFIETLSKNIPRNKFIIIRNAVDPERFKPLSKDPKQFEKYKINSNDKIISYVGRISEKKGVIDLLEGSNLSNQINKIKILLAGVLDKNSEDYYKINKLLKKLNLENKVIIQQIPNNELSEFHSCADVFVYLTKRCEALPRAILEAMACEKPILASPVAGIPDAIIDNQTGFIVNNPHEVAEKLNLLLDDENLRIKLGQNCRKKILNEFTYDVTLPKLVKLFQKIINTKS